MMSYTYTLFHVYTKIQKEDSTILFKKKERKE